MADSVWGGEGVETTTFIDRTEWEWDFPRVEYDGQIYELNKAYDVVSGQAFYFIGTDDGTTVTYCWDKIAKAFVQHMVIRDI